MLLGPTSLRLLAILLALGGRCAWASPTLVGFTPTSGTPGTEVLITGAGFDPRPFATAVAFGGASVPALQVAVDASGGSLRAIVPIDATTGPITVSTPGGTATSAGRRVPHFTVSGVPIVVAFHPESGTAGQRVTLIGRGLRGAERVEFTGGATAMPPFFVTVDRSGTTLQAIVPAGAQSGPITVVTADGMASTALLEPDPPDGSGDFRVGLPPTVDGFVPASGPPGTVVLVSGRNLFRTGALRLGGTALAITRVDDHGTAVEATIPTGAATGLLTVTTPGGTADTSGLDAPTFVVSTVPRIDDVYPPSGDPGTVVTIIGANFGRGPIPLFPAPIPSENVVRHGGTTWVVDEVDDRRTRIRARVGATSGGSASVVVESPGGQAASPALFAVTAAPVVTGFQPTSGVPGAVITVTGRNLAHATGATFAGVATAIDPGEDGTTVRATVPADAVTGPVAVSTAAGTASTGALVPPRLFIVLPTTPCGDGVVDPGETCDDGNLAPGDCCGTTCRLEPAGAACTGDGNACTDDVCDGAGVCLHVANTAGCDDGLHCNGADTCAGGACAIHAGDPCAGGAECRNVCDEATGSCLAPAGWPCAPDTDLCSADVCDGAGACTHAIGPSPACIQPVRTGAARLKLLRKGAPTKDRLVWTLADAGPTTTGDLGDPRSTTAYGLCLYDGTGALRARAELAPGGTCGGAPCWRRQRERVVYADPTLGTTGIRKVLVKAGRAGKARVAVTGKGAALGLPSLPVTSLPLTIQLHQSDGACWSAAYGTPKRNDPRRFQAKSDPPAPAGGGSTP